MCMYIYIYIHTYTYIRIYICPDSGPTRQAHDSCPTLAHREKKGAARSLMFKYNIT